MLGLPLAEVAPAAAGPGAALLALGVLVTFVVAYGMAKLAGLLVRVLFYPFTHISILGVHPFGFLKSVESHLLHYLGNAAFALEGAIAWSWHTIGVVAHFVGYEIRGLATDTYHMFSWLINAELPRLFRAHGRPAERQTSQAVALGKQNTAAVSHAGAVAAHASRLPYWKWRTWVDRQFGQVLPGEIAVVGAEVGTLGNRVATDAARLSRLNKILAALGLATLVGVGLNHLGLGHLRCKNNRRFGKALCGLPLGLLEGLLGGAVDLLIVLDICRLARFATRAAILFEPVLRELVVVVDAALCGGTREAPPALAVNGQPWPTPATALLL